MLPRTTDGGAINVMQAGNAARNEYYSRGISLFDKGLYTEAIVEFERVLQTTPVNDAPERKLASFYMGESYTNLGLTHLRMQMYHRAEEELKFALMLHPEYADLNYHLGVALYKHGKHQDATLCFAKALAINPGYARAKMYVGLCMLTQDDAAGMEHVLAAAEMQPAYADARYHGALDLWESGQTRKAVALLEDLVETDVDASAHLLEKGLEFLRECMFAEAADVLSEAVEMHPQYADLRNYLGQSYLCQDLVDLAIGQFQKALEINPEFVGARMNLASAYEREGRLDEARAELAQVLRIDRRNPEAEDRLARLQNGSQGV